MSKNYQATSVASLLWGAKAIGSELGISTRRAFYLLESQEIPAQKVGGRWVAARDQLHGFFRRPALPSSRPHNKQHDSDTWDGISVDKPPFAEQSATGSLSDRHPGGTSGSRTGPCA